MATFITSKSVGESININVQTSTGFWKYNHDGVDSSINANGWVNSIPVANINGEFTMISCLSDGTVSGDITHLNLGNNLLTSFDGTSLTSLINLNLYNNQLTSLDGFILPTSLTTLQLGNNQLTSFDATSFTNLVGLVLTSNPLTPSVNNQILSQLNQHGLSGGYFESNNGRSSASIADYNNLASLGWEFSGLQIIDTTTPPTFITSRLGEVININVQTSTGYWKYNHDGSDSDIISNGPNTIPVSNINGEFTIISCDSDGTFSGDITYLDLSNSQLTSFDGTGLSSLTELSLNENQLTSFDGTGLSSLINLYLQMNQLTSFDGTGLSSLTYLDLNSNQLASFDGTGLSSLTELYLNSNQLTSFDGTGLSSLTWLELGGNPLTTFIGSDMGQITELYLDGLQLTSFDGTGLSSLTTLRLTSNQFTSFDGTGLSSLTSLYLGNNQLTSFDGTGLSSLTELYLYTNQLTSLDVSMMILLNRLELHGNKEGTNPMTATSNDAILATLVTNGVIDGIFRTAGGRTLASNSDYTNLVSLSWDLQGLDVVIPPTFITSKSIGETINVYIQTSTEYWKYNHDGSDSSVFGNGGQIISITNANGEFTIIPCDSDGTVSGDLTMLRLDGNQITLFDGTGLSSLTLLDLRNNQLTSLDGFILPTSLTSLVLYNNQLTSFDGTDLTSLTNLSLGDNQLTSFDGTGLSSLTDLDLTDNQLTSFDGTGLSSLIYLEINGNPFTPSSNNQILNQLALNGLSNGEFYSSNGRTSTSNTDYDNLLSLGWTLSGLDLPILPTFITSKSIGETINVYIQTSTGYWKYNHDGSDSSINANGWVYSIPVANINGEFTIISCDSEGTVSGNVTGLNLGDNQLTLFNGTGLSSLTNLELGFNQLTSFDGTGLSSLTSLGLEGNPFTPSVNNQILNQLALNGLSNGEFYSSNGRTSTSNTDYDNLVSLGWYFEGLDLITTTQPTFITSKAVGESINIWVQTSTGFWKYNHNGSDSSVFNQNNGGQIISVTNANGEFTIISCDSDGTVNGDLTMLSLVENQITLFDGTGLSSLTDLDLNNNQLTSFDGTDLSSLTNLNLGLNQLTSFDGTGLSSLTQLYLQGNQLTSFDGTGLSSLTELYLQTNQLTSFDGTGLSSLIYLEINDNQLTSSVNNQILNQLNQNGLSGGEFYSSNGRTSASNADYDNLVSLGWSITGLDLIIPPTFITSKSVGDSININVNTSTGFWKYNHDGSDSSVFDQNDGGQTITITNINGEYTIISCDSDGTVSGDVTSLNLYNNQLTSFDGTGLSSLIELYLSNNQLTSFDGTGLSGLTYLDLQSNQLTSFDGTGLSSLTELYLNYNQLTSFGGTGLESLTILELNYNQLTSFDGTGLESLTNLLIMGDGKSGGGILTSVSNLPTSLTNLILNDNLLTSFDGSGLGSLTYLNLQENQLTSFDGTGLSSLSSLTYLNLYTNQLTSSVNNQILNQLNQNGLSGGEFLSSNGRTSASNTDYDNLLNNLGWSFDGLDLIAVGSGKLRVKGVNSGGTPPTQPWDGGTIYNIGAVVTHEGQTWNCIQYAPSGYGPFGGYIDVYWTL
jgi:Leucine-rich repeat (LRR) protein